MKQYGMAISWVVSLKMYRDLNRIDSREETASISCHMGSSSGRMGLRSTSVPSWRVTLRSYPSG